MGVKLKSDCFAILNKNGEPVLFRTSDASVNRLTVFITNKTGRELVLTGDAEGKKSSFQLSFEELLTKEVMERMSVTLPENWGKTFLGEGAFPAWLVYPTVDTVLEPDRSIKIELSDLVCPDTNPGNFYITYANIPGYDDPAFPFARHLSVINPPDPEKKTLPLDGSYTKVVHPIRGQHSFAVDEAPVKDDKALPIYITYDAGALIENGFTYHLTNASKDPLVPTTEQQDAIGAVPPPTVYISFLFGTEDYAVTTQQLADANIAIDVNAALPWKPVKHAAGASYWQFLPESRQVMGAYETVSFTIRKIITALNVDPGSITTMYIQINDVPGYNDMERRVSMHKDIAVAKMESLEPSKYAIAPDESLQVSWTSALAKRVTIDYFLKDGNRVFLDSDKGEIKLDGRDFTLPVQLTADDSVITAIAYDNTGRSSLQKTVKVAWPMAEILYFEVRQLSFDPELQDTDYIYFDAKWQTKYANKIVFQTPFEKYEFPPTQTSARLRLYSNGMFFYFTLLAYSINPKYTQPAKKDIIWN